MMEMYRRSETGRTGFDFFYGFVYIGLANINILDKKNNFNFIFYFQKINFFG